MADDQHCAYQGVRGWQLRDTFKLGKTSLSCVEGPIHWILLTVENEVGLKSELSFSPSHRDLKQFLGNWLIKGFLTFTKSESSELLMQVDFTCKQGEHVLSFESTTLKEEEVILTMRYTEIIGLGMVPRSNYNLATNMTDVCLVVEEQKLYLSKMILAHYSDFFRTMFFGSFPDSTKNEIEIKEVNARHFVNLLDLCFGSHLIRRPLVERLLKLADRFAMPIALQRIEAFLLVTDCTSDSARLDNVRLIQIADEYKFTHLMTQVMSNFTLDEYKELMKSSFVYSLSRDTTVAIMKRVESLCP